MLHGNLIFGLNKTTGEKKFILAGSGHIAGIINPENSVKYGYWTNETKMEDINEWFYKAKKNEGSWWSEWASWIPVSYTHLTLPTNREV